MLLQLVKCILSAKSAECSFEIVDQRPWCVSIVAVWANAGSEGDVVVDWRFFLAGVGEVGLLNDSQRSRSSK